MTVKRSIDLLIREIDPKEKNGRYLRENLRRIKQYLDDLQSGVQAIPVPSPSVYNNTDTFDVAVNGQTTFTLVNFPSTPDTSRMLINGVEQTYGTHWDITGNIAKFYPASAGFSLEVSNEFGQPDKVVVHYMT